RRSSFTGLKNDIPSALRQVSESAKPVLLLDMGDNVGGGGPANNCCLLEALEADKQYRYFVCIYDPQAVNEASAQKTGDTFVLSITGTGKEGLKTIRMNLTLLRVTDGNFRESNPRHGGQVNFRMGKTAVLQTVEGSIIMLTSLRV